MDFKTTIAAGLLALFGATAAQAATFDFEDIADDFWNDASTNVGGTKFEPTWGQIKDFDQTSNSNNYFVNGGVELLDVVATYVPLTGEAPAVGFFDSGNAGLGVCHSAFSQTQSPYDSGSLVSTCSTNFGVGGSTGDDNVTLYEAMTLVFDKAVTVTDMLFRGANHALANGTILINNTQYTVASGVIASLPMGSMTEWSFAYDDANQGSGATEFYLSSMSVAPVPVPASILLLGGAFAGFGAIRRKQRKAA